MKKIISGLILALLLSSCVTRRACERRFPDKWSDSISTFSNTVTVIRDTTIYVNLPGDTVQSSVPLTDISRLSTALATSTVWLKDGRLHHRLAQKDTTVATTLKGVLKTTQKTSTTRSQKERILQQAHPTNQLTGWQWTQVYLGRIFLGVLVVIFLWKVMNAVR